MTAGGTVRSGARVCRWRYGRRALHRAADTPQDGSHPADDRSTAPAASTVSGLVLSCDALFLVLPLPSPSSAACGRPYRHGCWAGARSRCVWSRLVAAPLSRRCACTVYVCTR